MRKIIPFSLFIVSLGLSACSGDVQENLGLKRKAPDEFAVVKHAPLAMPPDYSLRPPRPGTPRPQEQATSLQARQAVFGAEEIQTNSHKTDGESILLQKAGSGVVDPNIRAKVDRETENLRDRNEPVVKKLLGIGGMHGDPSASVVDAKAEAERLEQNAAAGKPVTDGETPSIEQ